MYAAKPTTAVPATLTLCGVGRVHANRPPRPHGFSLKLSRDEFVGLLDFTAGVERWSGRRVTQQSVIRTALREYLVRHRKWIETTPEPPAAAD